MELFKSLIKKYSDLQLIFKGFFLLIILFLVFFATNLFISIGSKKHQSAYSNLTSHDTRKVKLQDTRAHNWSELDKKQK